MDNSISIIFATGWALNLITWGTLLLIYPKLKTKMLDYTRERNYQLFMGIGIMMIGLLHVVFHNIWTFDYRGLITLFGWLALAKSFVMIVTPHLFWYFKETIKSNVFTYWIMAMFVIAIYFLYAGNPFNIFFK